ncbi:MAG: hypothetical protein RL596_1096 [Bacteroidota bacterium]|jgi:hypothetical protein
MKILSLKLDDDIFMETEKLLGKMDIARNRYINEAVHVYNVYNKKKLVKASLHKASKLTRNDAMGILDEFESLIDED